MPFEITLIDAYGQPFPAGRRLTLIGDGQVIARASIDNEGHVTFDASTAGIRRLTVRLDQVEAGTPGSPPSRD